MIDSDIIKLIESNGYVEVCEEYPSGLAINNFSFYKKNNISVLLCHNGIMIINNDSSSIKTYNIYSSFETILKFDYFEQIDQYLAQQHLKFQLDKLCE